MVSGAAPKGDPDLGFTIYDFGFRRCGLAQSVRTGNCHDPSAFPPVIWSAFGAPRKGSVIRRRITRTSGMGGRPTKGKPQKGAKRHEIGKSRMMDRGAWWRDGSHGRDPCVPLQNAKLANLRTCHPCYWQAGQMPKNSSLCVTSLKPFRLAMRLSIAPEKHSSISTTCAQRMHTR